MLDYLYPLPDSQFEQSYARTIVSKEGELLRAFADSNGVWRYPVAIEQVSPLYLQALLTYEDRWFYQHPGVNPFAMLRALAQNIRSNRVISGGSTLTMQVARLIDPHTRTIAGKLKQIFRALQLEWYFSKQDILSYYLNHAPFGGTLAGVQAASSTYLGKSAQQLSHAEAALLAVLPQAPSRLRPDRHPRRAEKARNKVLDRMLSLQVWTATQVQEAKLETVTKQWHKQAIVAPLLARRLLNKVVANKALVTTIDYAMQRNLAELVQQYIWQLPKQTSAAVLVVENANLAVRTYIGSSDFMDASRYGHVDMVQATRSPGSTLKPFLYALAIDAGLIHSESLLMDTPININGYRPGNFSRGFTGAVSVSDALRHSLNIPAVQVLHHLGVNNFVSQLKNAGLKMRLPADGKANLAVILGGVGTQLESLVASYTALANNGLSGKLRFLPSEPVEQRRFLSAGSAFIVRDILTRGLQRDALKASPMAWKTGTSYGFRDIWSIGVIQEYTMGVWIGRPDGTPLPGHYGARTAAPLLFSIMERIRSQHKKIHAVMPTKTVSTEDICWPLGKSRTTTPDNLCHVTKSAWILEQNFPRTFFDDKEWQSNPITIWVDANTGSRVDASCLPKQTRSLKKALWPLAVEPWIAAQYRRNHQLPEFDKRCQAPVSQNEQSIFIVGLEDHVILRVIRNDMDLPTIQLSTQGGIGQLYWYINGQEVAITRGNELMRYQFKNTGQYQITVIDSLGSTDMVNTQVGY
ncbi:MAG: penicillin-binding protein 1C [Methyloprofundus sp.]|nr:MAG: penicillin-binding protein 1C [Methyloprofundus sp.]